MAKKPGLHGIPEFEGKMDSLTEAIMTALPVAAMAGAQVIVTEWKRRTPVKTGAYRRSIHAVVVSGDSKTAVGIEVGTDIQDPPYPFFLEYGTSRMAAKPSMTPAFEAGKAKAISEAQKVFEIVVRKLAP